VSTIRPALPLIMVGLIFVCSCGAIDGGSRGTGITTTVQGIIASVQTASDPQNAVDGIAVMVQHHQPRGITNSAGSFQVQGSFDGHVAIFFRRRTDKIRAQYPIYVPSGGTMTLNGVHIDNITGTAIVDSKSVDYVGEITQIDCAAQILAMLSANRPPGDTDTYTVQLSTSSLVDPQGERVSCSQLHNGQLAHVQGTVNDDDTFGSALIVIE